MSKNQRLVTLPLDKIVIDLLADFDCRTISSEVAEILHLVTDKKAIYHVQFPGDDEVDIDGSHITEPRLWSIRHWNNTSERHQKIKLRGERERELWLVTEANVKVIAKFLVKLAALNPEAAQCIARMMLNNNETDKIRAIIGVRQLYKTSKEIQ